MDQEPAPVLLSTPLARPPAFASTRVSCAAGEVVLEAVRGGYSLVWSDGRAARRYAVALGPACRLTIELRAPRMPIRVVSREVLLLAPGSRLRGYLQVPLVPTVVWHPEAGPSRVLLELPLAELTAEWDDRAGTVFRSVSALHVRFPLRNGGPRAVVPVRIANPSQDVACPAFVPVSLHDGELQQARGAIVATPRRLQWNGESLAAAPTRRRTEVLQ